MKILLSGFCLLSFLSLSAQDSLTILFAGDAMMHQKQLDNTRRGDFFDLDSYFANIEREVKAVDIAVVNFEVPLGGEPYSGYPAFSAPENFALALQKAGFDFFLLANNHCLDRRTRGLVRTIQALDSLGIRHTGTFLDCDHRHRTYPMLLRKKDFRIIMLNYTYGTNGLKVDIPRIVNYIDKEIMKGDIAEANRVIVGCEQLKALSDSERGKYQSQAKIFRAMVMFDMVRLWGNFPVITTVGGDITEDNVEEMYPTYFPPQNTAEEAYAQIEKDLTEAVETPNTPTNDTSDKSILTKSVARAMLAKVYAEKPLRDYAKVIKYADELAADGFDLVEDFSDLWAYDTEKKDCRVRNTKEAILEAHFPPGSGNWCTWMFGRNLSNWDESFTWAKWITPSRDLIRLYEEQGDTKRYNESVVWYDCGWSNYYPADHYAFMYKCRSAFNSIIYLRYADILLLKAEAKIMGEAPDLNGAADIIDRIRNRAGLGKLPQSTRSSKEALLQAYMDERRMELAFEGQRWYDLCRLNKVEEVMNAVYAKDSGRHAQENLFNENSYLLAIPQGAIDQNENLIQNPGY